MKKFCFLSLGLLTSLLLSSCTDQPVFHTSTGSEDQTQDSNAITSYSKETMKVIENLKASINMFRLYDDNGNYINEVLPLKSMDCKQFLKSKVLTDEDTTTEPVDFVECLRRFRYTKDPFYFCNEIQGSVDNKEELTKKEDGTYISIENNGESKIIGKKDGDQMIDLISFEFTSLYRQTAALTYGLLMNYLSNKRTFTYTAEEFIKEYFFSNHIGDVDGFEGITITFEIRNLAIEYIDENNQTIDIDYKIEEYIKTMDKTLIFDYKTHKISFINGKMSNYECESFTPYHQKTHIICSDSFDIVE